MLNVLEIHRATGQSASMRHSARLAEKLEELNLGGEAFNFSSGYQISVMDMTDKILEVMDKKDFPIKILNEAKGEIKDQYLSIEKAEKVLGWAPDYSVEDALRETIDWYYSFFDLGK